jgi:hypothetical protein
MAAGHCCWSMVSRAMHAALNGTPLASEGIAPSPPLLQAGPLLIARSAAHLSRAKPDLPGLSAQRPCAGAQVGGF